MPRTREGSRQARTRTAPGMERGTHKATEPHANILPRARSPSQSPAVAVVHCSWCFAELWIRSERLSAALARCGGRGSARTDDLPRYFCSEAHEIAYCETHDGATDPYKHNGKCGYRVNGEGFAEVRVQWLTTRERAKYGGMSNSEGWIPEHNLIMAWYLGRPLYPVERVKHINGDTTDNRLANLRLYRGPREVTNDERLQDQIDHWQRSARLMLCAAIVLRGIEKTNGGDREEREALERLIRQEHGQGQKQARGARSGRGGLTDFTPEKAMA